jgi:uncharacterized protein YgiB involved in biofilm formation
VFSDPRVHRTVFQIDVFRYPRIQGLCQSMICSAYDSLSDVLLNKAGLCMPSDTGQTNRKLPADNICYKAVYPCVAVGDGSCDMFRALQTASSEESAQGPRGCDA